MTTPTLAALKTLRGFIGPAQLACIRDGLRGEEARYFKEKIMELAGIIEYMPVSYETDGQGDNALVQLHYFVVGGDWYITEKDQGEPDDTEDDFQSQAFGMADLGCEGELGYISIREIIGNGGELDLHWQPKTIGEVKNGESKPASSDEAMLVE